MCITNFVLARIANPRDRGNTGRSGLVLARIANPRYRGFTMELQNQNNRRMLVYKINWLNIVLKFLLIVISFNMILFFCLNDYELTLSLLVSLLVIGVEFIVFFMTKRLVKIEVTECSFRLFFRSFLFFTNIKVINQDSFQYSFKEEIGAKGVKAEELRFYENNVKVIGIGRGFDGWTKDIVLKIVNDLEKLSIKNID